jgi:hypothetical protein
MERSLSYFDDIWQNALYSGGDGLSRSESSEVIRVEVNETTIRLGKLLGLLPTSIGNEVASSGWLSIEIAAFLAVIDFNKRASVFSDSIYELTRDCNLFLTMDFRDSALSPIVAGKQWQEAFLFSNVQDRMRPRPMAVVGPLRSSVSDIVSTLGATRGGGSGGIPNIAPIATSSRLDNTEQYPFFGRTVPTNTGEAAALCLYLQSINVRRLAVLHARDTYGIDYFLEVQKAASNFGISIFSVSYTDGLDEGLNSAMAQLKTSGYKYFFGIFSLGTSESIVMLLYEQGLLNRPDLVWLFSETTNQYFGRQLSTKNEKYMQLAEALNGTGVVFFNMPEREEGIVQQLLQDFQVDEALVEYYLSKHLSGPLVDRNVSMFHFNGYTLSPSFILAAGSAYDAVMALGIGACEIESDFFTGPELFESLKKVEFGGATGRVSFDSTTGTRNDEDLTYQIYNLIAVPDEAGEVVTITPYQSQLIALQNASIEVLRPFVFFGGSTTPPQAQPVTTEDMNLVSDGIRSICWALSVALILLSVYCTIWTIMRRKTPVVRASQPIFLVMLSAGTFIMSSSIIPSTFQEPLPQRLLDVACMLDRYLFSVGFSMTFAALYSKTWRINTVHANAKKFRRVTIRVRDALLPFAILTVLNMVILVTWTIVAPLKWERIIKAEDMFGQPIESRGTCFSSVYYRDRTETTFLCLLGAVNVTALLCSNYQSYRARALPSEYNETVYMAMTNFIILEGMVLGAPILFLVGSDPASFMLINSLLVSIICLAVLGPMFVPKFNKAKDEKARRSVSNLSSRQFLERSDSSLRLKQNGGTGKRQSRSWQPTPRGS